MGTHYFVSYSRIDAEDAARQLADRLISGPPSYSAWLDVRDIPPGSDWDKEIRDAIRDCQALLFILTEDSVRDYSQCENEWAWALKYKKPIIPLKFAPGAALPFRLSSRQYIDFTGGFESGLARLRLALVESVSPAGVLRELRFGLADALRELPRAREESERARIEQDIEDLRARITEQERVIANPAAAAAATTARIDAGLAGQRRPVRPESTTVARAKFVNPPPMTAPTYFQDRHAETELLATLLRAGDARLVTVVGRGGVGKTALVCRLLKGLETGRLPDGLDATAGAVGVDGIVYLRSPSAHPVNFPNLFTDLCRLLPVETAERLLQRYQNPHESPTGKMAALLEAFPAGRWVVLLDNFEDLLDTTAGIVDTELDEALRTLLSAPAHGVRVVVTSRVAPQSLLLFQPGVQARIDLDEGLPSPYAEHLLRARDPDGKLGLKTAPDAQLARARERTRGYPRALEALAAILSADRNTTLSELLDQTTQLPENVVTALVGEAFLRLDPLAQQIMQALAVFPVPVAAVAVDYLLQPYQPTINAAPVLRRLVNMQFVRRDAGHYYLHQVDRDYALSRIPEGQPADREQTPPPFTRTALRHRGADYFTQIQTPREDWKTLDDLAPQLAEFELRYQGRDYDTAAQVLLGIGFDCLMRWGHYHLAIELHTRLRDHLTDPWTRAASLTSLGGCHLLLGNYPQAIDSYEQALTIARDTGNRQSEAANLGGLGSCHAGLGQTRRAIDLHEQALTIARDTGNREGEADHLGNLGNRYAALGQTRQAINLHEQALTIDRDIGYRQGEAFQLNNLGNCRADLRQWERAAEYHRRAIEIADAIGSAQMQAEARIDLARTQLWAEDLSSARQTIAAARDYPYPPAQARIALLTGIVALRLGDFIPARAVFRDAVTAADNRLHDSPEDYDALDTKALALLGLTLTGPDDHTLAAAAAFRAARTITSAEGITRRIQRDLDSLTPADPTGVIHHIRPTATGFPAARASDD